MTKVIVLGHGGYATAVKQNLAMLIGEVESFTYIDFNPGDDLEDLRSSLKDAIEQIGSDPVLFCADLAGGSPFREASMLALENDAYAVVAGLNTAGYSDIVYSLDLDPRQLAKQAVEASKAAIMIFAKE